MVSNVDTSSDESGNRYTGILVEVVVAVCSAIKAGQTWQ